MWAMQPLLSTATIEIRPQYKDPCHCKNCMIGHFYHTVVTLGLLWYQRLHKTPARQLVQIDNPGNTHKAQGHYKLSCLGNFHALMATGDSLRDV